tara:strand:+ start:1615 stop:2754 length:1140 start_codon:yes stop_codon:yes gene_type:complete
MSSRLIVNSIRHTGASGDAVTLANDGTCTANITNNLSNRNLIINGAAQINQRGDQTGLNGNDYTLDRWNLAMNNGGTWSVSQSTEAPDEFANSIKLDCTTADASLGAGDYIFFRQKLEGQNLFSFAKGTSAAKQFALSFYVKTNKSGVYTVELQDYDNNRIATQTFTVSDANWNRYELIYPADTTGAFDNNNAQSLGINIWLAGGSNYTSGTVNTSSWAAKVGGNRVSSSNVNLADSTSNEWHITGVQLEVGGVATDFEHRSYGDELARCQRYYQQIVNGNTQTIGLGFNFTTTEIDVVVDFPTEMRAAPSLEQVTGGDYFAVLGGGDSNAFIDGNWSIFGATTSRACIYATADSGTVGKAKYVRTHNASASLAFKSEL